MTPMLKSVMFCTYYLNLTWRMQQHTTWKGIFSDLYLIARFSMKRGKEKMREQANINSLTDCKRWV